MDSLITYLQMLNYNRHYAPLVVSTENQQSGLLSYLWEDVLSNTERLHANVLVQLASDLRECKSESLYLLQLS